MPLSQTQTRLHRSLQIALFAASVIWIFAATILAARSARGLSVRFNLSDEFLLLDAIFLVFLLAIGFAMLQAIGARKTPLRHTLGLPRRPSAGTEWATGAAIGWGVVLLAIIPMAISGALYVKVWFEARSLWLTGLNLVSVAILALASEITFRGYPYKRLIEAVGPVWATIAASLAYGLIGSFNSESTYLSTAIAILLGAVLCTAWLRTHGLWLGWGLHFAWIATLGILFGLPVSGFENIASVVETRPIGARWLSGGNLGPEGALLTFPLLIAAIVVVVLLSKEWAWDYARKPLIPAGYPMDVPPPAAHTEMEKQVPSAPALVQIMPTTSQNRSVDQEREKPVFPA